MNPDRQPTQSNVNRQQAVRPVTSVWKFDAPVDDNIAISMPYGARILCVQMQGDEPKIWAEVEVDEDEKELRTFIWRGTGHLIDDRRKKYIGTIQQFGGGLIFHLFETTKEYV